MIYDANPWWKNKQVPASLYGRVRPVLAQLEALMPHRQMILITGLRRTGKSTLMYQLIHGLLAAGVPETQVFYFSFDVRVEALSALLRRYCDEVLKSTLDDMSVTVFFDEIQKVPDWENQLKRLYDRYPKMKLVVSGSAQLTMLRGSRESLAGRFFEKRIHPLTFGEYLQFENKSIPEEKESYFETELKVLFETYLPTGGFIDCFSLPPLLQRQYLREGVLERVMFRDIPLTWSVQRPDALRQIMHVISAHMGFYLDYKLLGNDLNMDQRTVAAYVDYLDMSLLVQKCYNYSKNKLTSEKKLKRLYTANVGFSLALNPDLSLPQLCEQYFITLLHARYFYRTPRQEEVDIVILDDHQREVPVEIKIRKTIQKNDLLPMIRFMERFDCAKGIIVTKDTDRIFQISDNREIVAVPYWKYHTLNRLFGL